MFTSVRFTDAFYIDALQILRAGIVPRLVIGLP